MVIHYALSGSTLAVLGVVLYRQGVQSALIQEILRRINRLEDKQ